MLCPILRHYTRTKKDNNERKKFRWRPKKEKKKKTPGPHYSTLRCTSMYHGNTFAPTGLPVLMFAAVLVHESETLPGEIHTDVCLLC